MTLPTGKGTRSSPAPLGRYRYHTRPKGARGGGRVSRPEVRDSPSGAETWDVHPAVHQLPPFSASEVRVPTVESLIPTHRQRNVIKPPAPQCPPQEGFPSLPGSVRHIQMSRADAQALLAPSHAKQPSRGRLLYQQCPLGYHVPRASAGPINGPTGFFGLAHTVSRHMCT